MPRSAIRRFSPAAWLAALALLALSIMSAPARSQGLEGVGSLSCFGAPGSRSCVATFAGRRINPHVINVPAPATAEDRAAAEARDRRWVERCRPAVRQDAHGMPRYSYAAAGCEFGRIE